MKRKDSLTELESLITTSRQPVTLARMQETLGRHRSTVLRLIKELREIRGMPIVHSRQYPYGYHLTDASHKVDGFWLTTEQLLALLVIIHMLQTLHPGQLARALTPLRGHVIGMLGSLGIVTDPSSRIRVVPGISRPAGPFFDAVSSAVLLRQRLNIRYTSLETNETSQRVVSPQRLVLYDGIWHIDAWCHLREGLRTFCVDCIDTLETLAERAIDISRPKLDRIFTASYGIFSGPPTAIARLRFGPRLGRRVAREQWHPDQVGYFDESGFYILEIPYSRADELILDIMRHGGEVEVLGPPELRQAVAERHRAGMELNG